MTTDGNTETPCISGCGACCIAPHISSVIPGMPNGKAAGERCIQLSGDNQCQLFGLPERPKVCLDFRPSSELCGNGFDHALQVLTVLECATHPDS